MYRWPIQKHSMFLPILLCPRLPEQKCIKRAAWREKDNTIPLEVFQSNFSSLWFHEEEEKGRKLWDY